MMGPLYLGWRYVVQHRLKTGLLAAAMSLILFLPPALMLLIERGAQSLTERAAATPLLLGAPGSPLELTLSSLYFSNATPRPLSRSGVAAVDPVLADATPLYVRFQARGFPIVGTSPDYLRLRGLQAESGRPFALLGECVIGANVARSLGIGVGDSLISSPETLFDLAGVYPLKLSVVGVMAPSLTPDDDAIFTDLRSTWVIEGLGHGHQDLERADSPDVVLSRDDASVTANAALKQFNEITDENRDSFHFHGDDGDYPISGAIVVPRDKKSEAILLGRFIDVNDLQLVAPRAVIAELLETVFTIQNFVLVTMVLVSAATFVMIVLVLALSLRLRARERLTLQRMGAAGGSIGVIMASEALFVLTAGALLATLFLLLTRRIGATELVLLLSG
jgi:putative ABC transport system permease protein